MGAEQNWEAAAPRRWPRAALLAVAVLPVLVAAAVAARGGGAPDASISVQQADGWRDLPPAPVSARAGHVLAWTGRCPASAAPPACGELLVWGGHGGDGPLADGAAYDPEQDTWRPLPAAPRQGGPPGVWAGELVVWGATAADRGASATGDEPRGVAYDPAADAWRVLPEAPIAPRTGHTLTWTGREVVIWGGRVARPDGAGELRADGAAYDPAADAWRPLPAAPVAPRAGHAAVGGPRGTVVVYGSVDAAGQALPDGAVYDPHADTWSAISPPPLAIVAPRGAFVPALAWVPGDGAGLVYTVAPFRQRSRGDTLLAAYDPAAGTWQAHVAGPVGLRSGALAADAGGRLLVWGGQAPRGGELTDGALRSGNAWTRLPEAPARLGGGAAVSTGVELIVWGGLETVSGHGAALRLPRAGAATIPRRGEEGR